MARWNVGIWGLALLWATSVAHARVGESVKQSEARYGGPGKEVADAGSIVLGNARNVVYRHGDWIITAAYVDDVTLRIRYEKVAEQQPRARLSKEDVAEIIEAEDSGGWSVFNERSQKAGKAYTGEGYPPPALQSALGLMARYRVFSVTVESPAAARHEVGINPQQVLAPVRKRVAL